MSDRWPGFFLTVEGADGSGKSSQTDRLCSWLAEEYGKDKVLRTFEPGGWAGGALLRQLLLNGIALKTKTELLLFLADRSGHLDAELLPALEKGLIVVCERYADSTLAYQVWGRGLSMEALTPLLEWCAFPSPDLTVLLDVSPETAAVRLAGRGEPDRIEADGLAARVVEGYRELAKRGKERFVVVNAERSPDEVADEVRTCVRKRLEAVLREGQTRNR